MTCNNCIHNELCDERERSNGKFPVRPCDHYKAKSLFVELPCKVGDKVWIIDCGIKNFKITNYYIQENEVLAIIIADELKIETDSSVYYLESIGERLFFTKEEAERILKNAENN